MNQDHVIEKIEEKDAAITGAQRDHAHIRSLPEPERKASYFYRHKETGQEFLFVAGAFALPYVQPGFAVVAGLGRQVDEENEKRICVLEELESLSLEELLKGCLKLHKMYNVPPIMHNGWYCHCDRDEYSRLWSVMQEIRGAKFSEFYPAYPPLSAHQYPMRAYLTTLLNNKRFLDRGKCDRLKAHMDRGPQNGKEIDAFKAEDNPALAALAYAVAVLTESKPWLFNLHESAFNVDDY